MTERLYLDSLFENFGFIPENVLLGVRRLLMSYHPNLGMPYDEEAMRATFNTQEIKQKEVALFVQMAEADIVTLFGNPEKYDVEITIPGNDLLENACRIIKKEVEE